MLHIFSRISSLLKSNSKDLANVISAFQEHSHFCIPHTKLHSNHIFFSLAVLLVLPDELCLTHEANCFKPSPQPYFNIFLLSVVSYTFLHLVCPPSLPFWVGVPYFHSVYVPSSYNTSSPPPSHWQLHTCFFSPLFVLCVSLTPIGFPSYPSLQAIGTIYHYLWSCLCVFLNCLKLNSTISSSCLTSLTPSCSHLLSFPLSLTLQDPYSLCVSVCVFLYVYLSIYLCSCLSGITIVTDFGAICPCLVYLGSSRGAVPTCPSS